MGLDTNRRPPSPSTAPRPPFPRVLATADVPGAAPSHPPLVPAQESRPGRDSASAAPLRLAPRPAHRRLTSLEPPLSAASPAELCRPPSRPAPGSERGVRTGGRSRLLPHRSRRHSPPAAAGPARPRPGRAQSCELQPPAASALPPPQLPAGAGMARC